MQQIKELEKIKEIIINQTSNLGKILTDYIFSKISKQENLTGLKEISFEYYQLISNQEFLSKVHKRFNDNYITKLFSIEIIEGESIQSLVFSIKPNYSIFDAKSILTIGEFIQSFVNYKKLFLNFISENNLPYKNIRNFVSSTSNFKDLLNTIFYFIDSKGNIRDDATVELKKIRQEISNLIKYIPNKLHEFIRENNQYLVSNEVSYRNGRYVILLNSQYVSNFEGIVQDYSWTHKTAFFEPHFIINLNNKLTILQNMENIEIQKILSHLFQKIVENIENIGTLIKVCSFLEFFNSYFSLSSYFCLAEVNQERKVEIKNLINPLIKECVPIDIEFNEGLMIVGPNSGGKSAALKSTFLALMFSACGLPIFATKASLPFNSNTERIKVFYDIPDPQDITLNISTFSGHVKYWKYIIENLNKDNLGKTKIFIIMDEPASGTEPIEASTITIAIIEYFLSKQAFVIFTTHYDYVKNYFYKKITTASVDYDFQTNHPKYKLVYNTLLPSLPTNLLSSLPDSILTRINELKNYFLSNEYQQKLKGIYLEINSIKQDIQEKQKIIEQKNREIEEEKLTIKQKLKNELIHKLYNEYSQKIEKIIQEWEKELIKEKNKSIDKLEKKLKSMKNFDLIDYLSMIETEQEEKDIKIGDVVEIKFLQEKGIVKEIKGDKIVVEIKNKNFTLSKKDIK